MKKNLNRLFIFVILVIGIVGASLYELKQLEEFDWYSNYRNNTYTSWTYTDNGEPTYSIKVTNNTSTLLIMKGKVLHTTENNKYITEEFELYVDPNKSVAHNFGKAPVYLDPYSVSYEYFKVKEESL